MVSRRRIDRLTARITEYRLWRQNRRAYEMMRIRGDIEVIEHRPPLRRIDPRPVRESMEMDCGLGPSLLQQFENRRIWALLKAAAEGNG